MNQTLLSNIKITPELYEQESYNAIEMQQFVVDSQMADVERRFIWGLLKFYKPTKLIEIGVYRGGGSWLLLNAIKDNQEATLVSIDKANLLPADNKKYFTETMVGQAVVDKIDEQSKQQWNLIVGKDFSEEAERLNTKYDFAVIDTSHAHPIETLNFLTVLPYLQDGAVVILHDTSLSLVHDEQRLFAPRMLWTSVVAEKITTNEEYYFMDNNHIKVKNIGAFQITQDTRKYIRNVFESLIFEWEFFPEDDIENIRKLLAKHYSQECIDIFDKAVEINTTYFKSNKFTFSKKRVADVLNLISNSNVVVYGAGLNGKAFIELMNYVDVSIDFEMWDVNANKIGEVLGKVVKEPNFTDNAPENGVVLITIGNKEIAQEVSSRLQKLGWKTIFDYKELITN